jgi:hypothetical protein
MPLNQFLPLQSRENLPAANFTEGLVATTSVLPRRGHLFRGLSSIGVVQQVDTKEPQTSETEVCPTRLLPLALLRLREYIRR